MSKMTDELMKKKKVKKLTIRKGKPIGEALKRKVTKK